MKKRLLVMAVGVLCAFAGFAQGSVQLVNPTTVAAPKGYSQAAVVDLGTCKMVILSGQVPLDPQGGLVGKDDLEKQAEQVFRNIKAIVTDAGGTMDDVVRLGFYLTDLTKLAAVRTVRDRYMNTKTPPASTLVQVAKLYRDDVLIEVEATAIIHSRGK
jgi:2-iminobutanoate/2-iminopropanoate deaminase